MGRPQFLRGGGGGKVFPGHESQNSPISHSAAAFHTHFLQSFTQPFTIKDDPNGGWWWVHTCTPRLSQKPSSCLLSSCLAARGKAACLSSGMLTMQHGRPPNLHAGYILKRRAFCMHTRMVFLVSIPGGNLACSKPPPLAGKLTSTALPVGSLAACLLQPSSQIFVELTHTQWVVIHEDRLPQVVMSACSCSPRPGVGTPPLCGVRYGQATGSLPTPGVSGGAASSLSLDCI